MRRKDGAGEEEAKIPLISIVTKSVENIMKEIMLVKIFTGAALPWRKVKSANPLLEKKRKKRERKRKEMERE